MKRYVIIFLLLIPLTVNADECSKIRAISMQYGDTVSFVMNSSGTEIRTWPESAGPKPSEAQINDYKVACDKVITRASKLNELNAKGIEHTCRTSGLCYESWDALVIAYNDWISIAPAARQATVSKSKAISHYQPWLDAKTTLNNYTGYGSIAFFNVSTMVNWP